MELYPKNPAVISADPSGGEIEPNLRVITPPFSPASGEREGSTIPDLPSGTLYADAGSRTMADQAISAEARALAAVLAIAQAQDAQIQYLKGIWDALNATSAKRILSRSFDVVGAASVELVPGYQGRQIYVIGMFVSGLAGGVFQLGTGQAVNGVVQGFTPIPGSPAGGKIFLGANSQMDIAYDWPNYLFHTGPGDSVCATNSASEVSGIVQYVLGLPSDVKY